MSPTLDQAAALPRHRPGRSGGGVGAGVIGPLVGLGLVAVLVVGCGGSSGEPVLSPAAAAGKSLAQAKGCASCHVFYGRDAAGPTWKDVYGNEVTLADGTTVIADGDYLTRSIKDPWAQKVKGFGTIMPRNKLTDAEVASIVAYIKELGPNGQTQGTAP
ncbi:MAG: c-type cytochrome [Acidimicrobiales bacterium]